MEANDVLCVSHFYNENIVGTQRLKHMVSYLNRRGYHVDLINNSIGLSKRSFSWNVFKGILKTKSKCIFVSCGPFYYLWAAVFASVLARKKLIVDMRDPLSFNVASGGARLSFTVVRRKVYRVLFEILEKTTYRFACHFVVCTQGMYRLYAHLFSNSSKIVLIQNGYDFLNEEHEKHSRKDNYDKYVCIGKFFEYSVKKANETINKIMERQRSTGRKVLIHFYGSEERLVSELKSKFIDNEDIEIASFPRMEYREVIHVLPSYDCGIVVIRNEDFDYGTKIFDFIGVGIPVLDTFDHKKDFYNTFQKYLVSSNDDYRRFAPDIEHHRDSIWAKNEWIFSNGAKN